MKANNNKTNKKLFFKDYLVALLLILITLPAMLGLGNIAIFFVGLGVWSAPWIASIVTGSFLQSFGFYQGSHPWLVTEFDIFVYAFGPLAALQNGLLYLWIRKKASSITKGYLWFLFAASVIGCLLLFASR